MGEKLRLDHPRPNSLRNVLNHESSNDSDVFDNSVPGEIIVPSSSRDDNQSSSTPAKVHRRLSYPRLHSDSDIVSQNYHGVLNASAERVLTKIRTRQRALSVDSEKISGLDLISRPFKLQTLPRKLQPLLPSDGSLHKTLDNDETSLPSSTYSTPIPQLNSLNHSNLQTQLLKETKKEDVFIQFTLKNNNQNCNDSETST